MRNPNFCKTKLLGLIEKRAGRSTVVEPAVTGSRDEPVTTSSRDEPATTGSQDEPAKPCGMEGYRSNLDGIAEKLEMMNKISEDPAHEQLPRDFLMEFNKQNGINDNH